MPPQSSKVSHPGPSGIHPIRPLSDLRAARIATLVTALLAAGLLATQASAARASDAVAASPACLREPAGDSALLAGLDRMYRMEYGAADSAFSAALPAGSPGRAYFRGLNHFNRFNDLGDTASLRLADSLWTAISDGGFRKTDSGPASDRVNIELYRGLSTLQLSYLANLTRREVRAARLGRKAAVQLRPLSDRAEAAAALALYDYYKAALLKGLDWLPFVKADPAVPLRKLEESLPRSRYLGGALQVSLLWLYYDAGRYGDGLKLIDGFLARYPSNRLYRQMRADFLYRRALAGDARMAAAGGPGPAAPPPLPDTADLAQARDLHEALRGEYAAHMAAFPPPRHLPLGFLASVGNLVKIYGKLGRHDLRRKYAGIWSSSEFRPYLPWLPESLKREVESESR